MLRLESVSKRYQSDRYAVHELNLDVADGEVCVLVGPSGCGKTTTMKMINRLVEPTSGRIFLDDEDVTKVDPVKLRRRMGYVIQQIGLFPHESVAGNVATVPHLLGWDRRRTRARVDELLDLVGLDPAEFRDRYPDQLSGGQQQRVGVARALAADPPVLLMDEPFGAIDPIARDRLQVEFRRLQEELRKTVVFVTHDIDEAVKLGDRIAIFRQGGVLEQHATPAELLATPASDFVADFVGADRGLKRLSVTAIEAAELEKPPVVFLDASLEEARKAMDAEGARWAIVLDSDECLHGYLDRIRADGDGSVADRARRMEAWVPADASLKRAFSEMLLHDAGWIAVLDGSRYLGVLTPDSLHAAMRHSLTENGDHG
jgi:osmoprotectant transport system ATP-binding protein